MSEGAISQNEVASSSDATASGSGSSSPAPTYASAGGRMIDVEREKDAVPVTLPAPVYNLLTGDVYELPAETIKAVGAGRFSEETGGKSRIYVLDWRVCRNN